MIFIAHILLALHVTSCDCTTSCADNVAVVPVTTPAHPLLVCLSGFGNTLSQYCNDNLCTVVLELFASVRVAYHNYSILC